MSFVLSFIILLTFWVLLSGHLDFMPLFLGVLCSLLVTYFSHDLLVGTIKMKSVFNRAGRFLSYLPWLLYQIVKANLDVAYRALHPQMPIDPRIIRFRTDLESDFSRVTLANSITLTPGTVTIDLQQGEYIVHALTQESAEGLLEGSFQSRVKQLDI